MAYFSFKSGTVKHSRVIPKFIKLFCENCFVWFPLEELFKEKVINDGQILKDITIINFNRIQKCVKLVKQKRSFNVEKSRFASRAIWQKLPLVLLFYCVHMWRQKLFFALCYCNIEVHKNPPFIQGHPTRLISNLHIYYKNTNNKWWGGDTYIHTHKQKLEPFFVALKAMSKICVTFHFTTCSLTRHTVTCSEICTRLNKMLRLLTKLKLMIFENKTDHVIIHVIMLLMFLWLYDIFLLDITHMFKLYP